MALHIEPVPPDTVLGQTEPVTPAPLAAAPIGTVPTAPIGAAGPVDLSWLSPAAVRSLDRAGLDRLADDVRRFLVQAVSATGGHLGSNLGAVELTLALHRVFDSPTDRIVWDTGHQAYVHKLITGRAETFCDLRQAGGLSGYPNRDESAHDLVENSHASTALSYADGLARAGALRGGGQVVAVIGDGALTGGLAYEALNNIGASGSRVVVVLNDNGRSYSPTVSRLTTAPAETGGRAERTPGAFFGSLGLRYGGPVDGHDVEALDGALRWAARCPGPVVVHVYTVKGKGYRPAEQDPEKCLHDVTPFDPATGRPRAARSGASYTEAFGAALMAEAARRPEVVAVTAAMAGPTGLLPFARRFPDRFVDVGIAEQHAVTAAAGMALGGLRPVVAIYSTFLNRAWDQLYYDVGLHRLPVVFCIDRAGVTGDDGPSHHGLLDLALLTKIPGMTVLVPSCYEDVPIMLAEALDITDGPVAIRWPKTEARTGGAPGRGLTGRLLRSADAGSGPIGSGAADQTGRRVCLLAVGKMVPACQEAADLLATHGVEATVWDVRVASPLDRVMLADAAGHDLVVTAEDGVAEGGVGTKASATLRAMADDRGRPAPAVVNCGLPLAYLPHGRAADILAAHGLDGPGLARTVLRSLDCTV